MSLLAPLGLLGLLGLVALIIIYIIKPNYQSKFISSTYIWKLSLKYKRKKIPLSKLRNIILFICQVVILTAAALIIAQPILSHGSEVEGSDTVMIIDASASMKAEVNGQSRLERATAKAFADAKEAMDAGKRISLIIASEKASFILQQVDPSNSEPIYTAFDMLQKDFEKVSTFGAPDIEGAIRLAEEVTSNTKDVTVTLYTDTTYLNAGDVIIEDMKDPSEWNAAILDVRANIVENYYRIEVDVACYGADAQVTVFCDVYDANNSGHTLEIESSTYCTGDKVNTLVFGFVSDDMPEIEADRIDEEMSVYAYEHIHVYLSEEDSMESDNQFYLYGGQKPVLKVQYYSLLPNNYFTTALLVLEDSFNEDWDIEITEVTADPATEGFDIYIFEHDAPATVPTDGLVIYANAANIPSSAGIRFSQTVSSSEEIFLTAADPHPLMNNVRPERVSVTQFYAVSSYDGYIPLMACQDFPLLLLKEEVDQRILVMPFSLHYSNMAVTMDFPLILRNVIKNYFPVTLEEYVYEIHDSVTVNSRTGQISISGPDTELEYESFPATFDVKAPGTYTLMQTPSTGDPVVESIYVKLPADESNINLTEDILVNPYFYTENNIDIVDLLFYIAMTMVVLLFLEWWIKSRE